MRPMQTGPRKKVPWLAAAGVALLALALGALLLTRYLAPPARERVAGGNEPPAPRVARHTEQLDPKAL